MQTKAEIRARALADLLTEAGFTVEVKVEHIEPVLFSDGDVMLPARIMAHVRANGPTSWDDMYGFSFITWLAGGGRKTSTSYCEGRLYRLSGRHASEKLTLKQLRSRIGSEAASARYAAEHRSTQEV